jgi:hypothetical protein
VVGWSVKVATANSTAYLDFSDFEALFRDKSTLWFRLRESQVEKGQAIAGRSRKLGAVKSVSEAAAAAYVRFAARDRGTARE